MSPASQRTFGESGFDVSLPSGTSFRLADCSAYQALSGRHLKEMDVGWWQDNCLFLLELKGYEVWDGASPPTPSQQLLDNLSTKATDILLILSAVWLKTEEGKKLALELPAVVGPGPKKLKLIFLVDTPPQSIALLGPLKDKLNQILGGRMALYGVKHVSLIHLDSALKMGLPVRRSA